MAYSYTGSLRSKFGYLCLAIALLLIGNLNSPAFTKGFELAFSDLQSNDGSISFFEKFNSSLLKKGFAQNQGKELAASIIKTNISCDNQCDGTARLIVNEGIEPFTYLWSTGEKTNVIQNLCEGTYSVSVTDANNSKVEVQVEIGRKTEQVELFLTVLDATCNGVSNGSIELLVKGGVAPYQYIWSNGAITEDLSNLDANIYSVNVKDKNGCGVSAVALVSEPDPVKFAVDGFNTKCSELNEGIATRLTTETTIGTSLSVTKVFPSPADNFAKLLLQVPSDGVVDIKVFDLMGKEVMSQNAIQVYSDNNNEIEMNVGHLSNGMYLVNVVMNDKMVTARINIRH